MADHSGDGVIEPEPKPILRYTIHVEGDNAAITYDDGTVVSGRYRSRVNHQRKAGDSGGQARTANSYDRHYVNHEVTWETEIG